ncbi:uncharacterized protein LOC114950585 [Acropora millepora]|uniref:uncharacterized protein LOC114950585 n=1 Tax=Acropora millepora TaxID=45264 RepID=UPI001CF42A13|nr:uncharacterized protein LOC114950585 [Acropora millepora]
MSFTASCKCKKHVEWHHRSDVGLRVATFYEEKYCIFDSKHAGRKRKICLACRDRIAVEEKCRKLGDLNVNANSSTSVVTDKLTSESDAEDKTSHVTPLIDIEETTPRLDENFCPSTEENNHLVANNELAQAPSTLTPSNAIALSRVSTGTQVPGIPIRSYQDGQERTQRYMRSSKGHCHEVRTF